jgi:DNA helicase-2/ATP-dependent DNA helicase PcrA
MRKQGGQDNGWRPGQNVSHPKFGEGVIVQLEGSGSQARAHIILVNSG